MDQVMTDDAWMEKFIPATNPDGTLVEISSTHPDWGGLVEAKRVWTLVDCDGDLYLTPGVRIVNRMSYHYTEVPWTEGTPDVAWDVRNEENKEEE